MDLGPRIGSSDGAAQEGADTDRTGHERRRGGPRVARARARDSRGGCAVVDGAGHGGPESRDEREREQPREVGAVEAQAAAGPTGDDGGRHRERRRHPQGGPAPEPASARGDETREEEDRDGEREREEAAKLAGVSPGPPEMTKIERTHHAWPASSTARTTTAAAATAARGRRPRAEVRARRTGSVGTKVSRA